MLQNRTDYPTTIQLFTIPAGFESFRIYAFADFAILAAIGKFHPLRTTPHAIYSRCGNLRRTVHFTPLPGCRFPQFIVIGEGSPAGVAAFAIQSATSYQSLLHPAIFQISLCKYPCLFCPFTLSFPASRFRAFPATNQRFSKSRYRLRFSGPFAAPLLQQGLAFGAVERLLFHLAAHAEDNPQRQTRKYHRRTSRLISGNVCPVTGK